MGKRTTPATTLTSPARPYHPLQPCSQQEHRVKATMAGGQSRGQSGKEPRSGWRETHPSPLANSDTTTAERITVKVRRKESKNLAWVGNEESTDSTCTHKNEHSTTRTCSALKSTPCTSSRSGCTAENDSCGSSAVRSVHRGHIAQSNDRLRWDREGAVLSHALGLHAGKSLDAMSREERVIRKSFNNRNKK